MTPVQLLDVILDNTDATTAGNLSVARVVLGHVRAKVAEMASRLDDLGDEGASACVADLRQRNETLATDLAHFQKEVTTLTDRLEASEAKRCELAQQLAQQETASKIVHDVLVQERGRLDMAQDMLHQRRHAPDRELGLRIDKLQQRVARLESAQQENPAASSPPLSKELRDYVELVAFANETVVPDTLEAWADRAAALEADQRNAAHLVRRLAKLEGQLREADQRRQQSDRQCAHLTAALNTQTTGFQACEQRLQVTQDDADVFRRELDKLAVELEPLRRLRAALKKAYEDELQLRLERGPSVDSDQPYALLTHLCDALGERP